MPTYVYETIPQAGEAVERFEVEQRMSDAPLTIHPEKNVPVRRVIVGGSGFSVGGATSAPSVSSSAGAAHSCGAGCRHRH